MEYEPDNTAVIVVDMQNDFCHPRGALYAEGSEKAIEGANEVIERVDGEVFYTQDTHGEEHPEFEKWGEHCVSGTWGWQLHSELTLSVGKRHLVRKGTYDAFHDTTFHHRLQDEGIENLIICGTLVNVCVQETASTAALLGYDVYVVEDAVGYLNEEQKEAALDHIDFLIGDVVSVDDL